MYLNQTLKSQAKEILDLAKEKNIKLAFAESCTGGLLSALFTEIPGSSAVIDRSFITYSNQAKIEMLDVNEQTLEKFGAVSEETAKEMAKGAIKNSTAQISISITGIAGPDGGSEEKPVGLVYIGVSSPKKTQVRKFNLYGNRSEVRKSAIIQSLNIIIKNFS